MTFKINKIKIKIYNWWIILIISKIKIKISLFLIIHLIRLIMFKIKIFNSNKISILLSLKITINSIKICKISSNNFKFIHFHPREISNNKIIFKIKFFNKTRIKNNLIFQIINKIIISYKEIILIIIINTIN